MPVDPVGAAAPSFQPGAAERAPKQSMDGEVFMSLLVSQLRNQDPSSPMDTNAMIAQTTQLAMMEKMNEVASLTEEGFFLGMRSAAADLIGREVNYLDNDGETLTGTATAVSYAGPVPIVTVDGEAIALDAISGVIGDTLPVEPQNLV